MFEQIEELAQLTQIAPKVADAEQLLLPGDDDLILRLLQRLTAGLHAGLHEGDEFAAQVLHLAAELLRDLLETQARKMGVEVVGGGIELVLAEGVRPVQHAVLHIALGADDDEQNAMLAQAQKFDVAKRGAALRRQHHADELRQAGHELRRPHHDLLRRGGVDVLLQRLRQQVGWHLRLGGEHGVDKHPVAARGGNAPGRGVRASDQAHVFEIGHDVADGGRGQLQPRSARQRARTHRLTVGDVVFDQGFEQQSGAFVHAQILGRRRRAGTTRYAGLAPVL